jgi:methylenetetrahydrofolate reductase (NADPH)
MVFGPCGGVREDLSCELDRSRPCPFARRTQAVPWPGPVNEPTASSRLVEALGRGPVVLTDLTVPPFDASAVVRITEVLRDSTDALLVGEHQNQPDFSPALMAALVRGAGGNPWLTLTCRDRNQLVLEQELAGLRQAGADGVLCVTGDGRPAGLRDGATQAFDLDGTRLAALASSYGVGVAVAESPAAAPRALRPGRLLEKQRAGAQLAVLNHVGTVAEVEDFVRAARDAGARLPLVAAVAVYTDARSAQVLADLPGLQLDGERAARVVGARDPERAGIEAAVELAERLLAIEGVAGVNLSGMASSRGELHAAGLKAEIGRRIRCRS